MRLLNLSLLLSVAFCGLACEKNVQEVRRPVYNRYNDDAYAGIRGNPGGFAGEPDSGVRGSPGMAVGSPVTGVRSGPSSPHGAPKSMAGVPRTPGDR
jgi:hypothetical protein